MPFPPNIAASRKRCRDGRPRLSVCISRIAAAPRHALCAGEDNRPTGLWADGYASRMAGRPGGRPLRVCALTRQTAWYSANIVGANSVRPRTVREAGPYSALFSKSKKFSLFCVILSERTDASRRISPAQSKRGRGVYAPNSSANVTLRAQNCNALT